MELRKSKAKLVEAGIKQSDLAKKLGVSQAAVSRVVSGQIRSKRIERTIARELGRYRTKQAPR